MEALLTFIWTYWSDNFKSLRRFLFHIIFLSLSKLPQKALSIQKPIFLLVYFLTGKWLFLLHWLFLDFPALSLWFSAHSLKLCVCFFVCVCFNCCLQWCFFRARLLLLLRVQHTQQKLGREIPPQSFHSLYSRLCLISSHALMVLRSCFGFLWFHFVWLLLFFVCFILTCFIVQNVHHLRHIRNSYGLVLTLPSILFLYLFVVCSSFILSFICRFVVGFVFNLDLLKVVRLQHYSLFKWIFFGGVIVFGLGDDKSHFIVYLLFNASRESERKKSMWPTIFNYENITAGFGVEHMRRERVCVCVCPKHFTHGSLRSPVEFR